MRRGICNIERGGSSDELSARSYQKSEIRRRVWGMRYSVWGRNNQSQCSLETVYKHVILFVQGLIFCHSAITYPFFIPRSYTFCHSAISRGRSFNVQVSGAGDTRNLKAIFLFETYRFAVSKTVQRFRITAAKIADSVRPCCGSLRNDKKSNVRLLIH